MRYLISIIFLYYCKYKIFLMKYTRQLYFDNKSNTDESNQIQYD